MTSPLSDPVHEPYDHRSHWDSGALKHPFVREHDVPFGRVRVYVRNGRKVRPEEREIAELKSRT